MAKRAANITRICALNVNGIGVHYNSEKSGALQRWMEDNKADVMCLSETNVNWSKVKNKDTIWERTKSWFEHRALGVSYNVHDKSDSKRVQYGGTATILKDKIAHRHRDHGFDESGLGRWSWVRISGKQRCTTRFITVYCPGKNGSGEATVYAQHLTELQEDPIKRFWLDLGKDILKWKATGEQLILAGDWNENIKGHNITEWMELFGLKEAVTELHPGTPPPTYHRGSEPIDGIFVSTELSPSRSGYLDFGELPGDHRGIWIDIPNIQVLGYKMKDITKAKARRLKLDDPRVINKYLKDLHSIFVRKKVYSRLKTLKKECMGSKLSSSHQVCYEELDKIRYESMKEAERKCRKLKMGGIPWSPQLQTARDTILFWTLIKKKQKRCHVSTRRILRLKRKLKIQDELSCSQQEVVKKINAAYTSYKALKVTALELRLTFLEALAQVKADHLGGDAVKVLRDMQHREQIRTIHKRIGYSLKKGQNSTTKIHVRTPNGFTEVTQMLAMETYIQKENENKFHQTEGWCPLLEGQLFKDLGSMGDGPKVKEVLAGTYSPPPGTSEATSLWLKSLKVTDPKQRKWLSTSFEDYKTGWNKVKERTSSGELHIGHFKAGSTLPTVGWVHYTMAMLPMHLGFSPSRWQKGTDVMLLKEPEVYFLDKLRTIVLYEADFNQENKRLGKDTMTAALHQKEIAVEQYSRPGRSAQDNALGKRLVFDHFRFLKLPFGMCACDLKSCYDRVVHTAASIALQRIGVPLSRIRCMFSTIQNLIHTVRTAFGTSTSSYGGKSSNYAAAPQGLGQGNGAGPTIWSVLSSTVFTVLHSQGFSTRFCSALSLGLLKLCGFSYVDDCDLIADGTTVAEVYTKLQSILTTWDEVMQVNGGAIAPDKCWWYLVDFEWSQGRWKYSSPGAALQLQVRDKDGVRKKLPYMSHNTAREMVGVHLAPDGTETHQVKVLRKKTQDWAQHIRHSPLDEEAVWTALRHLLRGVEYPLAATSLKASEIRHIMAPALMEALPRANIVRSMPRAVLYGPLSAQGFGLTNPYIYQHCRHIQDITSQPWRGTQIGQLIVTNLEAAKLEAGVYGSLFDNEVHITWFNTTNSWLIGTYNFCREHEIAFDEQGASLGPSCANDRAIMEVLSQQYTASHLKLLNMCRLYARVTSISDIVDGSGRKLHLQNRLKPDIWSHNSAYKWPQQDIPPPRVWKLWVAALKYCLASSGESITLPLGQWVVSPSSFLNEWKYFLTETDQLVYKDSGQWWQHHKATDYHYKFCTYNIQSEAISVPPWPLFRTTVSTFTSYIKSTGTRPWAPPLTPEPISMSPVCRFEQILFTFPDAEWICQWMVLPPNLEELVSSIRTGGGYGGVSDGSYQKVDDICSAAWIFRSSTVEMKGGGVIPGPTGESNSYRGELGGLLGLVLILLVMEMTIPPTHTYTVTLACDGESALYKALCTDREYFNTTHPCVDLISRIIALRENLRARIIPTHVAGHQDERGGTLTPLAALNVRMDSLAKEILQETKATDRPIPDSLPPSPDGIPQVDYCNTPIVSRVANTLAHHIGRDRLLDFWEKQGRFKAKFAEQWIHWDIVTMVMKESSTRMRRFISKWVSRQTAVGKIMLRRDARACGHCPRCGAPNEDTLHVLRCPHPTSREQWRKGCKTLRKWMRSAHTHPRITRAVYHVLRRFGSRPDFDTYVPTEYEEPIQLCLNAQSHLGWTGFLEGFLTYDWAATQHNYLEAQGSRKTGRRWAIGLSTQVWRLVFTMWQHRNNCLHEADNLDRLSGLEHVNVAIQQECTLGLGNLDPIYLPYLRRPSHSLLKLSSTKKRQWLALVRRARESKGHPYIDSISTTISLRRWIGLPVQRASGSEDYESIPTFSRTGYRN